MALGRSRGGACRRDGKGAYGARAVDTEGLIHGVGRRLDRLHHWPPSPGAQPGKSPADPMRRRLRRRDAGAPSDSQRQPASPGHAPARNLVPRRQGSPAAKSPSSSTWLWLHTTIIPPMSIPRGPVSLPHSFHTLKPSGCIDTTSRIKLKGEFQGLPPVIVDIEYTCMVIIISMVDRRARWCRFSRSFRHATPCYLVLNWRCAKCTRLL